MRTLAPCFLLTVIGCGDGGSEDTSDTGDATTTTATGTTTGGTTTTPTGTGTSTTPSTSIVGTWMGGFGAVHTITNEQWSMDWGTGYPLVFNISTWDESQWTLSAQNDPSNGFYEDLWSRFDWTWSEGDLYYCQTAYAAVDESTALGLDRADDTDLSYGCSGFPWTSLAPL